MRRCTRKGLTGSPCRIILQFMVEHDGNSVRPRGYDELCDAIVKLYSHLTSVSEEQVRSGFEGGLPFDSILGVEMASHLENQLGVRIPEASLMRTSVYESLGTFAMAIQDFLANLSGDR